MSPPLKKSIIQRKIEIDEKKKKLVLSQNDNYENDILKKLSDWFKFNLNISILLNSLKNNKFVLNINGYNLYIAESISNIKDIYNNIYTEKTIIIKWDYYHKFASIYVWYITDFYNIFNTEYYKKCYNCKANWSTLLSLKFENLIKIHLCKKIPYLMTEENKIQYYIKLIYISNMQKKLLYNVIYNIALYC